MSKRFHPGRSAQSGVMAAMLAQKGFTGPTQIWKQRTAASAGPRRIRSIFP